MKSVSRVVRYAVALGSGLLAGSAVAGTVGASVHVESGAACFCSFGKWQGQ